MNNSFLADDGTEYPADVVEQAIAHWTKRVEADPQTGTLARLFMQGYAGDAEAQRQFRERCCGPDEE